MDEISSQTTQSMCISLLVRLWRFAYANFSSLALAPYSPPRARGYIPASTALFLGRDSEVEELVLVLIRESEDGKRARICILGPGGMGKTELAVKVLNHPDIQRVYRRRNLLFVACDQAVSATLLLDILYAVLDIRRDTQNTINDILDDLRSSGPLILLLDNFETPLYADVAKEQVEQILRDIEQIPHVAIVVTMRGNTAPCEGFSWVKKEVEPLTPSASHDLFTKIYPEVETDSNLAQLLEVLGYMPLAIMLMAKLG
ncbi:P-loop containing nucleoside triphosphate hydrolase protein [Mycena floridula]|nr:P-loop containing nucleoside triphosphate hydrolase protein [Mycena floridula]